jgi:hypothetical protein
VVEGLVIFNFGKPVIPLDVHARIVTDLEARLEAAHKELNAANDRLAILASESIQTVARMVKDGYSQNTWTPPQTDEPRIGPKAQAAIEDFAKGDKHLTRHLERQALHLIVAQQMSDEGVARAIRKGETR